MYETNFFGVFATRQVKMSVMGLSDLFSSCSEKNTCIYFYFKAWKGKIIAPSRIRKNGAPDTPMSLLCQCFACMVLAHACIVLCLSGNGGQPICG